MRRKIKSSGKQAPPPLERLGKHPRELSFPLSAAVNRTSVEALVAEGDSLAAGAAIAKGASLTFHTPLAGTVSCADADWIRITVATPQRADTFEIPASPSIDELPALAGRMGLVGMGGSMFPASIKLAASRDVHTLVVNAVECEPGIEIDEALLLERTAAVVAGIRALQGAIGFNRIVLALKRSSLGRLGAIAEREGWELCLMSEFYPAGAEKLIVGKLAKRQPPSGVLPFHWGYLVMSGASLWSFGISISEGRPCLERPLTLVTTDGDTRNLIVPLGCPAGHVVESCGLRVDPERDILIAGGLMMGRRISLTDPVLKGTNALFVLRPDRRLRKRENPCILCGACFDACPLHLHPAGMAERIRNAKWSLALGAQLQECFLCGACSAVCPANIPLVHIFQEGKQWSKEQS
jgi:electron transport complex protein RnfC